MVGLLAASPSCWVGGAGQGALDGLVVRSAAGQIKILLCKKALLWVPSQTNLCSKAHRG